MATSVLLSLPRSKTPNETLNCQILAPLLYASVTAAQMPSGLIVKSSDGLNRTVLGVMNQLDMLIDKTTVLTYAHEFEIMLQCFVL